MIGAIIIFITAIIGFTINATGFLDAVYMDLTLTLPKFDYKIKDGQETGNETFEAFQQMRMIGAGILGGALVYAGIVRVLENESIGIVQRGISNQIISNSLIFSVPLGVSAVVGSRSRGHGGSGDVDTESSVFV